MRYIYILILACIAFVACANERWTFVHNNTNLISMPFYSGSITITPYILVECETFIQVTNSIITLNLQLTPEQEEGISNIVHELELDTIVNKSTK